MKASEFLAAITIIVILIFLIVFRSNQIQSAYQVLDGNIKYFRKDYDQAFLSHRKALSHNPNDLHLILKYGDLLAKQGSIDQVIEHYQNASKVIFSPDIEFRLGHIFRLEGQFDSAIMHFQNVHYLSPSKFRPLYQLVKTYEQQGDFNASDSLATIIINWIHWNILPP